MLGCGNPLLDISAEVPQAFLDKYKVKLNDAILAQPEHLPIYDDLVQNFQVQYIAGGATQNSIRVCQWMIQKPNATSYIGSVGNDKYGETLRKCAQADGVHVKYHVDSAAPTGTCAVLVCHHDRSLIANLGAANNYKFDHLVSPAVESVWKRAKFIYIAGFFLTVSPPSIMHMAKHAAETGKLFAMNLAAPFICQFFSEPLLAALAYCDIVIGNESEAAAYAEKMGLPDKSATAVGKAIAALPFGSPNKKHRTVIITHGAHATVVIEKGEVKSYPVPPVPESELVDLNGAGDAFVGGLLAWLAKGKSVAEAVGAGHYAASVVVRQSGCTLPKTKPTYV